MSAGRILVIIPARDESASLPHTLREIRARASGLDLLVVDDGSRDGTSDAARAERVPVLRHVVNLGVGAALQTGIRYALERGYDVAVQLDADGQHDPAFLDALTAPVLAGECDVAIGSRYVTRTAYRAPLSRRLGMLLFSGVVRLLLGQRISDTTSGFRAYNRAAMAACQQDLPRDFPDAPFLIALARRGLRLREVAVEMRERTAGESFYTVGKALYYPYKNLLASLMAWLKRPA